MHANSSQPRDVKKPIQRITKWIPALVCSIACLPVGCASVVINPDGWPTFTLVGQSANVHADQGYASGVSKTNSPLNYFFGTQALYLSSTYNALNVEVSNHDVLVSGTNHIGAGDVYDGIVYGVIENWSRCSEPHSPILIVLFDGSTLAVEKTIDISHDVPEASGIAIVPEAGEAIVTSFCDPSRLYAYDMSSWTLLRKIRLTIPVPDIQGAAYRDGVLYIARSNGTLYGLRLHDSSMQLLYKSPLRGEFEGLDFHSDQLRWLVNYRGDSHILYSYAAGVSDSRSSPLEAAAPATQ